MGTNATYPSMEWLVETFMHLKECCERMKIDNFNAGLSDELPVVEYHRPGPEPLHGDMGRIVVG